MSNCKFETHYYSGTCWEKRSSPIPCCDLSCPHTHKIRRAKPCKNVDTCLFSDCKLLHNTRKLRPSCIYKKNCKNTKCVFRHPSDRSICPNKNCSDQNCTLIHSAKACNYGIECKFKDTCIYRHVDTTIADRFNEANTCSYIINGQRCPRIVRKNKLCVDHYWMKNRDTPLCCECGEEPVHFLIKDEDLCCKCFSFHRPTDWKNIFDEYVYNFPSVKKEHDELRKKMKVRENIKIFEESENKIEIIFAFLYFGISHISEYDSLENKKTFRKLSLLHHPDKNKGNDENFKALLHYYEVLKILF